jgi:hypothetical protein
MMTALISTVDCFYSGQHSLFRQMSVVETTMMMMVRSFWCSCHEEDAMMTMMVISSVMHSASHSINSFHSMMMIEMTESVAMMHAQSLCYNHAMMIVMTNSVTMTIMTTCCIHFAWTTMMTLTMTTMTTMTIDRFDLYVHSFHSLFCLSVCLSVCPLARVDSVLLSSF